MQLFVVVIVAIIASVSAFAPRSVARPSRVLVSSVFWKIYESTIGSISGTHNLLRTHVSTRMLRMLMGTMNCGSAMIFYEEFGINMA